MVVHQSPILWTPTVINARFAKQNTEQILPSTFGVVYSLLSSPPSLSGVNTGESATPPISAAARRSFRSAREPLVSSPFASRNSSICVAASGGQACLFKSKQGRMHGGLPTANCQTVSVSIGSGVAVTRGRARARLACSVHPCSCLRPRMQAPVHPSRILPAWRTAWCRVGRVVSVGALKKCFSRDFWF